jgi:tRNA-Thr(GGU) m(6)t(6)A37 methyltransferase TsaA
MDMQPIGIIHSPFTNKDSCPIQPLYAAEASGTVEVYTAYAAGLRDIETFSHLYLIYLFDRAGEVKLVRPTFLDDQAHGVFASRHPSRPSAIGISVVRLERRQANILFVCGLDVLDATPLLDIKPYLPRYDAIATASAGWTEKVSWRPKPSGRE